ncbi:vacuolar protein sorting 29 b [Blastocystis sp. ATCC 50177/Nand II]|uniref:Vacuolar protein sorting 29 b n=1 Tax=Blastocystis sp. subtype 1 (strain ATCC 50177 / NandII) TaxID=478820 RepID=A0A196SMG8_BLAHN|nr:vacuolar protein sorting 29 b [Blastocystis sp. ATCC 50177/Nand II]
MSKFGELVLVVGDACIPFLEKDFPEMFKKMFVPDKFNSVILTGNMYTSKEVDFFKRICPNVYLLQSCADYTEGVTDRVCKEVAGYKIVGVEASSLLFVNEENRSWIAKKEKADIVVYGDEKVVVEQRDGVVYAAPGSVTGAAKAEGVEGPSFVLLSLIPSAVNVFTYTLKDGKLDVKKDTFPKSA